MASKFQVEEITDQEEKTSPDFPTEETTRETAYSAPEESTIETTPQMMAPQPEAETPYYQTPSAQQPPVPPQEQPPFGQPQYPEKKSSLKTILIIIILLLLLGAVVYGAIQVYQKAVKKQEEAKPSPTPISQETALPTPEISPSPESTESAAPSVTTEEKERGSLKVKVLNGGGVPGAAGTVATALEKLGYKNVRTGNADKFNYEKSEITYLSTKKDFLSMFETDLKDYEIGAKTATDSSDFDFTLILGKK